MSLPGIAAMMLGLLAAPGPTNALVALAGAEHGWRRGLRLIPVVLAGYATTVLPLAWLGRDLLGHAPALASIVRVAAAGWVLWLAMRLWRSHTRHGSPAVSLRTVFFTTLLNPKALVIGLVLLPASATAAFPPALAILGAAIALVTTGWLVAGSVAGVVGTRLVQRIGAVCLTLIALGLLATL